MENKIKVIANYLPQFHRIPENDKWWGEGFTDWEAVKNATPLFKDHDQPRRPMNNYYYDLSDISTLKWQADLAKKYGIYGFGIYHYWFNSEQILLQKPAELIRDNKDIDIHYLFIWDNTSWTRTWKRMRFSNDYAPSFDNNVTDESSDGVLARLDYGKEEDWKKHFDYILPFFKDDRYIKINNKPVFVVFVPHNDTKTLKKMFDYWNYLAQKDEFDGIFVISRTNIERKILSEYSVVYEPAQSTLVQDSSILWKIILKINKSINRRLNKPEIYSYKHAWNRAINYAKHTKNEKIFYSGFVGFDDTARRGEKARIIKGGTPELFEKYFIKLLQLSQKYEKEYVFLTAWNEWGEGAYLEPDTRYGTAYLEAVKRAIDIVNK